MLRRHQKYWYQWVALGTPAQFTLLSAPEQDSIVLDAKKKDDTDFKEQIGIWPLINADIRC